MPIFEYQCADCDTQFENLVLGRREKTPDCPDCSSTSVEKVYSTFAAHGSDPASADGGFCESPAAGMCGSCGDPGPCGMN